MSARAHAVRPNLGRFASEEAALAGLVDRLVTGLDPQEIWLFGSRAEGRARPDSDFDLLVIAKPVAAFGSDDYDVVRNPIRELGIACDIVPCSFEDCQEARTLHTTLVSQVFEHGRKLYGAEQVR